MEFSGIEFFFEIFIAGLLFCFGVSPILVLVWQSEDEAGQRELFPRTVKWEDVFKPWLIVAIAIVYAVGVAGNRLVEETFSRIPALSYQVSKTNSTQKPEEAASANVTSAEYRHAELVLKAHGDSSALADWLERHKSYRKILRAGSASSLLFLLSSGIHVLYRRSRTLEPFKDIGRNCLVALLLFAFFTVAFRAEDKHYKENLWKDSIELESMMTQKKAELSSNLTSK